MPMRFVDTIASHAADVARHVPDLKSVSMPVPPLPPGAARILPNRTLTSLIPRQVRDLARYAQTVRQTLPEPIRRAMRPPPQHMPMFESASMRTWQSGFLADHGEDSTGDVMRFQYNPEEITDRMQTAWLVTDQIGHSHPFVYFGGSAQRKIEFTLKLNFTKNEVGNVKDNVNWLRSYQYPANAIGGVTHPPSTLLLHMGELYKGVHCVLLDVDAKFNTLFRPDLTPLYAEVRIVLLEISAPLWTKDMVYDPTVTPTPATTGVAP